MALTEERAEKLANYLAEKKEYGYELLEMDASEAVAKINPDGFDFTAEEFQEFADSMKSYVPSNGDELDENSLDNVAGGIILAAAAVALSVGYYFYRKSKKR